MYIHVSIHKTINCMCTHKTQSVTPPPPNETSEFRTALASMCLLASGSPSDLCSPHRHCLGLCQGNTNILPQCGSSVNQMPLNYGFLNSDPASSCFPTVGALLFALLASHLFWLTGRQLHRASNAPVNQETHLKLYLRLKRLGVGYQ